MGVDLTVWRMRIGGFRGPSKRRKKKEDPFAKWWMGRMLGSGVLVLGAKDSPLSREGKLWRRTILRGAIVVALLSLFIFYLLSKVDNGDQQTGLEPSSSSSTTTPPLAGKDTNNDIVFNVPHLLLLGGDIEQNPGPDKKISWDDENILARSSCTPLHEWIFKHKPENQALQDEQKEAKRAAAEESERQKREENERRDKRREEENIAWLQGLDDEVNRQALEAEEKRRVEEEARLREEDGERRKKSEDVTLWTPTESTTEPTPTPPHPLHSTPSMPEQVETPQPSSHTSSAPENPMSPEVSK